MKYLLLLFAVIWFVLGCLTFIVGKGAVHEILAGVLMVISAVFLSAASIVEAVDRLAKLVRQQVPPSP